MQVGNAFKELVYKIAIKNYKYDSLSNSVEPEIWLNAMDLQELIRIGIQQYGFRNAPEVEACIQSLIQIDDRSLLSFRAKVGMDEISVGDILILEHSNGAILKILYMGNYQFSVVFDKERQLLLGDIISPLQYAFKQETQLVARVIRDGRQYPNEGKLYRINKVESIGLIRNILQVSSKEELSNSYCENLRKVYALSYDTHLLGFSERMLGHQSETALFEIDVENMTYQLNPYLNCEKIYNEKAALEMICNACTYEGELDNLFRIRTKDKGMLSLCPTIKEGHYAFRITKRALIFQI